MTNQELAAALRLCADDGQCQECPKFDPTNLFNPACVNSLQGDAATALENHETHIAALQREIEGLRKRLELAQKPQWVSVEERLPEPMEWVLCLCGDGKTRVLMHDHILGDWDFAVIDGCGYAFPRAIVTHWMPLPEPPSTEGVE